MKAPRLEMMAFNQMECINYVKQILSGRLGNYRLGTFYTIFFPCSPLEQQSTIATIVQNKLCYMELKPVFYR